MVFVNCYNESRNVMVCGCENDGSLYFVDPETSKYLGNFVRRDHLQNWVSCLTSFPDGTCLAGFSDGTIYPLDMRTCESARSKPVVDACTKYACVAISRYDRSISYGDGTILTDRGSNVEDQPVKKLRIDSGICSAMFCSESLLISGHDDGRVLLWDFRKDLSLPKHEFCGHVSQVQQIVHGVKWAASSGLTDLHIGVWAIDDSLQEHSLATDGGSVVHMDAFENRLGVLCKNNTVLIFRDLLEADTKLERRIILCTPGIAILLLADSKVCIARGSTDSMQISLVDENKSSSIGQRDKGSIQNRKSIQESLDVSCPIPILDHQICNRPISPPFQSIAL